MPVPASTVAITVPGLPKNLDMGSPVYCAYMYFVMHYHRKKCPNLCCKLMDELRKFG